MLRGVALLPVTIEKSYILIPHTWKCRSFIMHNLKNVALVFRTSLKICILFKSNILRCNQLKWCIFTCRPLHFNAYHFHHKFISWIWFSFEQEFCDFFIFSLKSTKWLTVKCFESWFWHTSSTWHTPTHFVKWIHCSTYCLFWYGWSTSGWCTSWWLSSSTRFDMVSICFIISN